MSIEFCNATDEAVSLQMSAMKLLRWFHHTKVSNGTAEVISQCTGLWWYCWGGFTIHKSTIILLRWFQHTEVHNDIADVVSLYRDQQRYCWGSSTIQKSAMILLRWFHHTDISTDIAKTVSPYRAQQWYCWGGSPYGSKYFHCWGGCTIQRSVIILVRWFEHTDFEICYCWGSFTREVSNEIVLDCFTLLSARHLVDVSCYIISEAIKAVEQTKIAEVISSYKGQ